MHFYRYRFQKKNKRQPGQDQYYKRPNKHDTLFYKVHTPSLFNYPLQCSHFLYTTGKASSAEDDLFAETIVI